MRRFLYLSCAVLAVLAGAAAPACADDEEPPVVRAIMFQRPT